MKKSIMEYTVFMQKEILLTEVLLGRMNSSGRACFENVASATMDRTCSHTYIFVDEAHNKAAKGREGEREDAITQDTHTLKEGNRAA